MLIDLNGLKIALTAVLNSIGNKMDKINPTGVGDLSVDGNAEFSGDVIANGYNGENPISLNNVNSSLNGISCSVKSLQSQLQLEENLVETTSEDIQALFI